MPTQVFPVIGEVRQDRTLDSMAEEIENAATDFVNGSADSDVTKLMSLSADYRVTHAHRAAQFQESASQMQSPVPAGAAALNQKHEAARQEGMLRGVLPVTPDHGFVEGVMPADLMPSMERDE